MVLLGMHVEIWVIFFDATFVLVPSVQGHSPSALTVHIVNIDSHEAPLVALDAYHVSLYR